MNTSSQSESICEAFVLAWPVLEMLVKTPGLVICSVLNPHARFHFYNSFPIMSCESLLSHCHHPDLFLSIYKQILCVENDLVYFRRGKGRGLLTAFDL